MKGIDFQWVRIPPGNWSFQPVTIGATTEQYSLGARVPMSETITKPGPSVWSFAEWITHLNETVSNR